MHWEILCSSFLENPERDYVLVSLIGKKGSSYLQPGARMLVRDDGAHWGGISAGCLEDTIAESALDCLRSGRNRVMEIDTRPFFGCFGQITILLEVLVDHDQAREFFNRVSQLITDRASFQASTHYADISGTGLTRIGNFAEGENVLIETVKPVPRILVFGDWPDGEAVADISRRMGWAVQCLDAAAPGFDVQAILDSIKPDNLTAAVVMTHNFARDLACLMGLLPRQLGYIGLIGSRKRREEISNALIDTGGTALLDRLDQIRCPAGLDLGGDGHEAVALAVVAEIQGVLCGGTGMPLHMKNAPVHATGS